MSKVITKHRFTTSILSVLFSMTAFMANIIAQGQVVRNAPTPPPAPEGGSILWYLMMAVLVLSLVGAIGWLYKTKKLSIGKKGENDEDFDPDSLDADAELEWFRKNTRTKKKRGKGNLPKGMPRTSRVLKKDGLKRFNEANENFENGKDKLKKKQFELLPINNFSGLNVVLDYDKLPLSDDEGLMSAIEQAQDEYEEDVMVRELSVKILAKFRKRNSIEALSQIVLYDLSAQLRSRAVSVLAEFDHESVFETILLACADPSREVRAAAARALFQLSFDRGEEWTRIAECGDDFRMVQAARAAIESDLVRRSIDRLVHEDEGYAYEAFALVSLLIKAGETKEVFEVLENHVDKNVKLAILQTLKVLKDEKTLPALYSFIERNSLPEDLSNAANEVVRSFELVPA